MSKREDLKRNCKQLKIATTPFPPTERTGNCEVQLLRSIGPWSLGLPDYAVETSIHRCYLDIIGMLGRLLASLPIGC